MGIVIEGGGALLVTGMVVDAGGAVLVTGVDLTVGAEKPEGADPPEGLDRSVAPEVPPTDFWIVGAPLLRDPLRSAANASNAVAATNSAAAAAATARRRDRIRLLLIVPLLPPPHWNAVAARNGPPIGRGVQCGQDTTNAPPTPPVRPGEQALSP